MNENKLEETPVPASPDGEENRPQKPIRRISLAAAIFLALLLCTGVFLSTYTVMMVRMSKAVNEQKEALSQSSELGDFFERIRELYEQDSRYAKLNELLSRIEGSYVREYEEGDLWDGIYAGLFGAVGDPYSEYMTADEYAAYTADRSGSYVGVGIHVVFDPSEDAIAIYRVTHDSPAEAAGLQAGDLIVGVEDVTVSAATYTQAVNLVTGAEGTEVTLTIRRGEETLEKKVKRAKVMSENVLYERLDNDIAYITILSFAESTVTDQFEAALEQAQADGCTSYLFDVRNNPGGSLNVICDVLDLLLPEGVTVHIVNAAGEETTRDSDAEHFLDAPMAVLCNGSTASAAELFTADLRDYGLAKLVGETTFGKGTVQTISPLDDGSAVKLTTSYYTPMSGVSYDGVGILPDVEIALSAEQASRFYLLSHEEDPQLQAAIQLLTKTP